LGKLLKDMPKNEEGGDGSNQHKKATPTKTEGVAQDDIPTYSDLGIDYKDASNSGKGLCTERRDKRRSFIT